MQAPYSQQPQVRRRFPLVAVVLILVAMICIGLIVLVAAVMVPTLRQMGQAGGCGASFSMMRQAVLDYSKEKGGALPNAATWEDDVAPFYQAQYDLMVADLKGTPMDRYIPFVKPGEVFTCTDDGGRKTGIAFNKELSGVKLDTITDKANTVVLFEVPTTGRNQHQPYELVRAPKPRMMNTHRDWLVIPLEGEVLGFTAAREAAREIERAKGAAQKAIPAPK